MSGDHVVSAAILRQIAVDKVALHGAGTHRVAAPDSDSFKVKRLCQRHNSALSDIDTEAGRFFRAVQDFNASLTAGTAIDTPFVFFHLFDIERWMLKTMLMAYFGRLSNVTKDRFVLPDHATRLFAAQISPPYGLFVPTRSAGPEPKAMVVSRRVELSLITEGAVLCGINVALGGIELRFTMDGHPSKIEMERTNCAYRPKFIHMFSGSKVFTIGLASEHSSGARVALSPQKDAVFPSNEAGEA